MKEIACETVTAEIARLCQEANTYLAPDLVAALRQARGLEESPAGQAVLEELLDNARIAAEQKLSICQDTGMAVVFAEIGQEVHITGGSLTDAINAGVARGYTEGFLRASVVSDPLLRQNTGDNTPAVIRPAGKEEYLYILMPMHVDGK